MKPLPSQQITGGKAPVEAIPSLPGPLSPPTGQFSTANRRSTACPVQRVYPWLLSISTATAALFCLMYITKPVMIPAPASIQAQGIPLKSSLLVPPAAPNAGTLLPGRQLPGEQTIATAAANKPVPAAPSNALPSRSSTTAFEETNLRIQHILTAEAPGGHVDRIDIDVPVLYHSRSLRWTPDEVAAARDLLVRLMDYQEKSRQLRSEGVGLLDAWNRLIGESIPASELRADSPSLPENQQDAADSPRPAGLTTTESIQIQAPGK